MKAKESRGREPEARNVWGRKSIEYRIDFTGTNMKTLAQTVSRTNYTNLDESKWKKNPRWKGYILGALVVASILMIINGRLDAYEFDDTNDPEFIIEYNRRVYGEESDDPEVYLLKEPCEGFIPAEKRLIDTRGYSKEKPKWKKKNHYKPPITPSERVELVKQMDYHLTMALNYYNQAEGRSWYLPQKEGAKLRHWFASMVGVAQYPDAKGKAIGALIGMITQYGNDCIDEWYTIQSLLEKAKQHYDSAMTIKSCLDYYKK